MRLPLYAALCLWFAVSPAWAIGELMRITNISDFNLSTWNIGDPAISEHSDICIYALNVLPLGGYAITISSNPSGYRLSNGSGFIPYTLKWEDSGSGNLGSNAGTQLTDGVKLTGRLRADILSQTCFLGGPNARLNLAITQASMTAALAGSYSGTITLLLSPN